jgi:hypothetical protein
MFYLSTVTSQMGLIVLLNFSLTSHLSADANRELKAFGKLKSPINNVVKHEELHIGVSTLVPCKS